MSLIEALEDFVNKRTTTPKKYQERLTVCNSKGVDGSYLCPNRNKLLPFCNGCGCELHAKANAPREKCPLNKWEQ